MIAIVSVALPESLKRAADEPALQRGVSLDAFIASAVAERISALRTVAYSAARAGRAGRGAPPVSGDELPADVAGPDLTGPDLTGPDLTGGERS